MVVHDSDLARRSLAPATPRGPAPRWPLPLAILALWSCQSYQPKPLDPEAHRTAWQARTPEADALRPFLERLELDVADSPPEFDPADGLGLREGQLVALAFNPRLRLARLDVRYAAAGAEHAGRWSDPWLSFNALRIAESIPDPWVLTPSLMFAVPWSGRLAVERDLAGAELDAARAAVRELEWSVCREVERAWFAWSALHHRQAETRRFVESLDALVRTTSALANRGELAPSEASLFPIERARQQNRLRRLTGDVAAAEQELRAVLGLAPEAPVVLHPALAPTTPAETEGADHLAAIAARNPRLARLRSEYRVAEDGVRREIKKQYPDLQIGPLFDSDGGQTRTGLTLSVPLPFLNANRRRIAEARVERERARAALETAYEAIVGRWAAAAARADAWSEQLADLRAELVPLVDRQVERSLQLLQLGEGDVLVLLQSLELAHQTNLDLIAAQAGAADARAEVAFLVGPERPATPTPEEPVR